MLDYRNLLRFLKNKADFVNELNDDDLILDNLYEFTEFCSTNIERLL